MRKDITITAELRSSRGKNEARRLRAGGLAPAVVYGAGKDSVAISIKPKEIVKILHGPGHNTIFNLNMDGSDTTLAMIVDWQNDPIRDNLLHVDLKRIDPTKRLSVKVPIHTAGECKGVKLQGGLLEAVVREVEIECLPDDIPDQFTIDVTELMIGQSIRAAELPMSGSMKLVTPAEAVLAHVVALKAEAAAPGTEVAAATPEPEVVKKGKKEEEAEEGKGKKK